jgi:hypothetical protein
VGRADIPGLEEWRRDHGKPDKGGVWTANRQISPSLARYLHLDDNNRLNPDGTGWVVRSWLELDDTPDQSVFILREDKDDPATETRITLHPGMRVVIDTERLWHVVWHPGPRPRYAVDLIALTIKDPHVRPVAAAAGSFRACVLVGRVPAGDCRSPAAAPRWA